MSNKLVDLRHPLELPIYIITVMFNFLLIICSVVIICWGQGLIAIHTLDSLPGLNKYMFKAQQILLVILFILPLAFLWKKSRRSLVLGNCVKLSEGQFPQLYEAMKNYATELDLKKLPELYLTHRIDFKLPVGSTWKHDYIIIETDYYGDGYENNKDALNFLIASRLAMLKLGYTRLWYNFPILFTIWIPYLLNPLFIARTYTCDRYGAFFVPEALQGMLILVMGRHGYKDVNLAEYLTQSKQLHGVWAFISQLYKGEPHKSYRVRAVYEMELFYKSKIKP